ncbi:MAG: M23 family metallopeptidase [Actinobacteria bacterium]|nr:M23 family metallopeptidase [Actinomycetota bacterium]
MAVCADNLPTVRVRFVFAALGGIVAFASASPVAAAPPRAKANALAVRIVIGEEEEKGAEAVAPPTESHELPGFVYGDGIVVTGAIWTRARTVEGEARARARATATIRTVSLFGGEITVGALSTKALARASGTEAEGSLGGSWLADVVVLGETVRPGVNVRVPLEDWGYAILLEQAVTRARGDRRGRRTSVNGLRVHLTADHGGLPAGSEVVIGAAEAAASAPKKKKEPPPPEQTQPEQTQQPSPATPPPGPPRDPEPQPPGATPTPPPVVQDPPPRVKPRFTADGYVFPVYGPSTFTNDFAAARALTGWHHGNDIFAPAGAPILAVTDGTLFLVGWNDIGGNRLWLRDTAGNEFYYAHLSAFSPLAYNGSRVRAGDVIGFVGASGDAVGTPPHLHFEIHPAALLGLGYDGVINPYRYLLAWRKLVDASFDWGEIDAGDAPAPGAVILQAEDIATTSGLDPVALSRALEMPALFGEGLSAMQAPVIERG